MKTPLLLCKLISASLILMSCTCSDHHIYYSPPPQNVPALGEKGEGSMEFGICMESTSRLSTDPFICNYGTGGFFFQGSYSPKLNIGLVGNFMKIAETQSTSSTTNSNSTSLSGSGYGFAFDLGGGYYTTLDSLITFPYLSKFQHHFFLEGYSGLGLSSQHHKYGENSFTGTADLSSTLLYIQPVVGIRYNFMTIGFSTRMNCWYYNSINWNEPAGYPGSQYVTVEKQNLQWLKDHPFQSFVEPAFTIRAGWKGIMLSFQYVMSTNLGGMAYTGYESQKFIFGLHFAVAPSWFEHKKPKEELIIQD